MKYSVNIVLLVWFAVMALPCNFLTFCLTFPVSLHPFPFNSEEEWRRCFTNETKSRSSDALPAPWVGSGPVRSAMNIEHWTLNIEQLVRNRSRFHQSAEDKLTKTWSKRWIWSPPEQSACRKLNCPNSVARYGWRASWGSGDDRFMHV